MAETVVSLGRIVARMQYIGSQAFHAARFGLQKPRVAW